MRNKYIFGLGAIKWRVARGLSPVTHTLDPPLLLFLILKIGTHKISEYFVTTTFNKRVSSEKGQQQHVVYGTYRVVYLLF